jgi:hypothetical protein
MSHPAPARAATRRELRQFAWTVGGAFAALGALLAWRGRGAAAMAAGALGAALLAAGALAPGRLGPVHRAWMALALAISRVTTPAFLGVLYFGMFTPLGAVLRLLGRRPLARRRDAPTFWADRPPGERRSDLRRQF